MRLASFSNLGSSSADSPSNTETCSSTWGFGAARKTETAKDEIIRSLPCFGGHSAMAPKGTVAVNHLSISACTISFSHAKQVLISTTNGSYWQLGMRLRPNWKARILIISGLLMIFPAMGKTANIIAKADDCINRWNKDFYLVAYQAALGSALVLDEEALTTVQDVQVQTRSYILNRLAQGYFELGMAYPEDFKQKAMPTKKITKSPALGPTQDLIGVHSCHE